MAYNLLVFEKGGNMKKAYVSITMLLLMLTFIHAEIKTADVTGDGIEDEIKIGERIVIVIDGASGKRWVVWEGKSEENYQETVDDCSVIWLGDIYGLRLLTSGMTVKLVHQGNSIFYFCNGKWHEMEEKYSKGEYEATVNAGSSEEVLFVVLEDEVLVIHDISYGGAGGTIIIIDCGIKVNIYNSEGEEYYSGVFSEIGDGISDWVFEGCNTGGEPFIISIVFDNSDSSAYRKVSYSATVYSTK